MSQPPALPDEPRREPDPRRAISRHQGELWLVLALALAVWVVYRLGIFPLTTALPGDASSFPRAYFNVDHPFHTARAGLIRDAWSSLDTVRWVASHQGGYPAEFFPFGVPAVAASLSLVTFGALEIETAWAITVALIFLLPAVGYWVIGREDRLTPAVALVAFAGHVAIASDWTHGGFTELVEWGLATNVAGATFALIALPLVSGAVERRSPRLAGLAAAIIALCAASNPRSLIAVAVAAVAILLLAAMRRDGARAAVVVGLVALLAAGLAVPVVMPLLRYSDLYFFLSYQEYLDFAAYRDATVDAVTWPVLLLAAAGVALAFVNRTHRASQAAALTLVLYVAVTSLAVLVPSLREAIPQLELPRLMPFQRMLTIWVAAYGALALARLAIRAPGRLGVGRDVLVAATTVIALLVVFTTALGPFGSLERGLREVPKTEGANAVELDAFRDAVAIADAAATDDAAILVIGSRLSWHEQLWAPMEASGRRLFYDDWLWYWHRRHDGPYDYRSGHFYPNPSEALSEEYLATHGIGAVVLTDKQDLTTGRSVRDAVAGSDLLIPVGTSGQWNVYTVRSPMPLATLDGSSPVALTVSEDGETIRMRFEDAEAGTVLVRQNWFPRWEATVNGESQPVTRRDDGYMAIETASGDLEIELRYAVTMADAIARFIAVASLIAVVAVVAFPTTIRRWARRGWSAGRA